MRHKSQENLSTLFLPYLTKDKHLSQVKEIQCAFQSIIRGYKGDRNILEHLGTSAMPAMSAMSAMPSLSHRSPPFLGPVRSPRALVTFCSLSSLRIATKLGRSWETLLYKSLFPAAIRNTSQDENSVPNVPLFKKKKICAFASWLWPSRHCFRQDTSQERMLARSKIATRW